MIKMLLIFWIIATLSPSPVCQEKDSFSSRFGLNSSQDGFSPLNPVRPVRSKNKTRANSSVEDFSITYQREVVSLRSLMRELTRRGVRTPSESDLLQSAQETKRMRASSCRGRCGLGLRNKSNVLCFCDIHCNHFGDCCYDFHSRCPHDGGFDIGPQTCENANQPNITWHGDAMISTCPKDKEASCFSSYPTLKNLRLEVPVVDRRSKRTYRSVTCASCNNITDVIPWVLTVRCSLLNDVTNIVDWLKRHPGKCNWKYKAPSGGGNDVNCILRMTYSYAPWQRGNLSVICEICNSYAMVFKFKEVYHRNPHCVLCDPKAGKGDQSEGLMPGPSFRPPTLTVFFNFNTNEQLPTTPAQDNITNTSRAATKGGRQQTTDPKRVITIVGCCVSIVALLVLIVVYALFKELRNLPGKVLMNLACSIICYQALFLSSGQTSTREVCVAIAVLLHYFLMVSFMWTAVMGYDLAKTFTSKGANVNQESNLKTLVIYCCLAWGGPLIFVAVCFTLDVTGAAYFGYGMQGEYCWIHSGLAKIFSMGIPVSFALLFNIVALVRTMIAIRRTKKASQRVATRRARPSLAFLCFKLTVVLGVPWVLGFVANYALVLQYIYIVLNAFQGLFISLVFLTNKRVLKLIRLKVCSVNSEDTATRKIRSQTTKTTHAYYQETKSLEEDDGMEIPTNNPEFVKDEVEMKQEEQTTRI